MARTERVCFGPGAIGSPGVQTSLGIDRLREPPRPAIKLPSPARRQVHSPQVSLPKSALTGRVVRIPVTGVFNIHGTSRRLTVSLEMRLSHSAIDAVGSLTFPWGEFNMTAPSVGGFVNVTNQETMEFDLHLKRA